MSALPDYDLLVAGDGPYRGTLKSIAASEGVDGRVEFLGYVEDTRLPSLYAGATAHVTFSSFEAYGMTVAESLAAGTPCVVRESAALVDWVDRTGVVGVTEPTTRAVANAVKQIAGVTPTESVPSWETVTSQLLGLYRESLPEETTGN